MATPGCGTILTLLTFSSVFGTLLGCLCPPKHDLKERFCEQDIVFKGTVMNSIDLSVSLNPPHNDVIMYKMKVERLFRGYLGEEVWLSSSKSTSSCGVHLREGSQYLLTTSWDKSLHSCDWNVPMSSLTEDELYVINRNLDCVG